MNIPKKTCIKIYDITLTSPLLSHNLTKTIDKIVEINEFKSVMITTGTYLYLNLCFAIQKLVAGSKTSCTNIATIIIFDNPNIFIQKFNDKNTIIPNDIVNVVHSPNIDDVMPSISFSYFTKPLL